MKQFRSWVGLLAIVLAVVSCGGGGGGGETASNQPSSPPPAAVMYAYVANTQSNTVSGYSIDAATGRLIQVVGSPFATGAWPMDVGVASKRFLYVTNLLSDNVSGYSIDATTGALTSLPGSPFALGFARSSFVSHLTVHPSGKFLYVQGVAYSINETTGALTAVPGSTAAGRSVAISPSGKFAYGTDWAAFTVTAYAIDTSTGALTAIGTPMPAGTASPPDIAKLDPSGRFLYVTTPPFVLGYAINGVTGALDAIAGSPFLLPRSITDMAFHPAGTLIYGTAGSHSADSFVTTLAINQTTGALSAVTGADVSTGLSPIRAALDPSGRFLYVGTWGENKVYGYSVDPTTGALTQVVGSPFPAGNQPEGIATVQVSP